MRTVDLSKLRVVLTPHALRGGQLLDALTDALYTPLRTAQARFEAYRAREEREREYGPTVFQLRLALSDLLECAIERVRIVDLADVVPLALYRESRGAQYALRLGSAPLAVLAESRLRWSMDFTVIVPAEYEDREAEIRALLDKWKLAGTRYYLCFES